MENFIKYVHIHNFKSIADLKIEDCGRINLFIGYPNVGKSNVLEALSLFSLPFLNKGENLNKLVRVENKNELFYDLHDKSCIVETNIDKCSLEDTSFFSSFHDATLSIFFEKEQKIKIFNISKELQIDKSILSQNNEYFPKTILKYVYNPNVQWKSNDKYILLPPFGENIVDILSNCSGVSEVNAWIKNEFVKKGLEYLLDIVSSTIKIQQRLSDDKIKQLPYSLIADTLQRVIFYKTAIASNKNSVLLFEEPEVHAFPPYIANITQDIIEARTNQFFIVTHSPFVINDFLEYEHLRRETSIYLFDFKNNQTTVKRLTDEEIDEVYEYGIDLFFNIESFLA